MKVRVAIIGAGPCGLGAAYRLKELGENDFIVFESSDQPGGLASSYTDAMGFTWDVGGHVQFSHYEDFDRVMNEALPDGWIHHQRESWIWIRDRFIPYPFQNNLWRLPESDQGDCLRGLENLKTDHPIKNFSDWIESSFGEGISNLFMRPYNLKVWAHPLTQMSSEWIGERVATVDLKQVRADLASRTDRVSWGPNATFQFPKKGGTGAIWKSVAKRIGDEFIRLKHRVVEINPKSKTLRVRSDPMGEQTIRYDYLLSAMPIDRLASFCDLSMSQKPLFSRSHIVGLGLRGQPPEFLKTKCWMYFPESNCPFYRVTVFSNYSPANVPDAKTTWSLMAETAASDFRPLASENIIEDTIRGLINTQLISESSEILSRWSFVADPGYPTPFVGRDEWLHQIQTQLEPVNIYSRGRFGAWKYEVSNQDHTFMQGFEWADWLIRKTPELTYPHPKKANASGKRPAL